MIKPLSTFVDDAELVPLQRFLFRLERGESSVILHNDILLAFERFREENPELPSMSSSRRFLRRVQEILRLDDRLILVYRYRRASCRIYSLPEGEIQLEQLTIKDFLAIKERLIRPELSEYHHSLELNLAPFYDYGPNLKDPETIGNGIRHLNRYMSTSLTNQFERWTRDLYDFLKLHHLHGVQLLIDGEVITSTRELEMAVEDVVEFLERSDCPQDPARFKDRLRRFGFLDGWGDNHQRILETVHLLQDILEQPNESTLEEFLARIPMVSKVALITPHGWFAQENVLGRPDTGGQVVYILDQARALEKYLEEDLRRSGFKVEPTILIVTRLIPEAEETTCNERLEKVHGTKNVWILRVPFHDEEDNVVPHWISRFRIWPYLDRFAIDAEAAIRTELEGLPDLLVGNYSDGNLVAALLSKSMGVIQCNIAHALEKSKYLFSDLYWQQFEEEYHFSVQFMADLIAMNQANFIITSTRQEITGTDSTIGQYESYQFFTMPGLMQVISGIDLFHPRFNVIPPGVNEEIFFHYQEGKRRPKEKSAALAATLFEVEDEHCRGRLANPERPPIFTIARLDRIKNVTGFVEAYGENEALRQQANVVLVASVLDPDRSGDSEEAAEIRRLHELIDRYELHGHVRWVGKRLSKEETGEAYRLMADRQGVFVQPALFEAFGLTILEAMHSGLPVFATHFGGPQEIIEEGVSGFLVNPTDGPAMTRRITEFFVTCAADPGHWQAYSENGLERARNRFTWKLHCRNLTRLTKVYGFWKYSISNQAKNRLNQYCHLLYHLFYLARAQRIE